MLLSLNAARTIQKHNATMDARSYAYGSKHPGIGIGGVSVNHATSVRVEGGSAIHLDDLNSIAKLTQNEVGLSR